ncbi:MAG: AhpC/TSA family protein [Actinomycetota bacterium]
MLCERHLVKMAEQEHRLKQADAAIIVVSFEAKDRVRAFQDRLRLPFVIALDPQRVGYRNFGLGRAGFLRSYTHPDVVLFYAGALLHGRVPSLHRGQDRRQLGGDFVLDGQGVVVLAHPESGPEDRVAIGEILEAVEDAASRTGR